MIYHAIIRKKKNTGQQIPEILYITFLPLKIAEAKGDDPASFLGPGLFRG